MQFNHINRFCLASIEGSGEEHRYAGALFKEKKAFESLIAAKEHMVISLPDHPADVLQEVQSDKLLLSMDTRTMQKGAQSRGPRSIVVDVRDFRCTLPSVLYGSGKFAVVPRTLQVGDYVLSPEICVERKGISDLFQSFASGRLYNQAESMFRHYKHPCLLIEFSQDKAFCLLVS
jgi:DNA excision repair protein ERCC-4